MDRKNINRGFKKLRVWQDAVNLYILAYKIFSNFPFELKKTASNTIGAAYSISRNISEGFNTIPLTHYSNIPFFI
jgi:four helix bundle protein